MNINKLQIIYTEKLVDKEKINMVSQCMKLPKSYLELIVQLNGFVDNKGVKLYSIDEIQERNETYEVSEYLPGYVAVGDDSGGNLFLMKADSSSQTIYISDSGSLLLDENEDVLCDNFIEWIQNGCSLSSLKSMKSTVLCKAVLKGMPQGGAKDLLKIKKIFGCNSSIGDMLLGVQSGSFTVAENMTKSKAKVLLNKLGDIAKDIQIIE